MIMSAFEEGVYLDDYDACCSICGRPMVCPDGYLPDWADGVSIPFPACFGCLRLAALADSQDDD